MKKIFTMRFPISTLILLMLFIGDALASQDSITIKVFGENSGVENLTLTFEDENNKIKKIVGRYDKDGIIFQIPRQAKMTPANLRVKRSVKELISDKGAYVTLFLKDRNLNVICGDDNFEYAQVEGDDENEIYSRLRQSLKRDLILADSLYSSLRAGNISRDSDSGKALLNQYRHHKQLATQKEKDFIKEYPDKFVSVHLLNKLKNFYTSSDFSIVFNSLSPDLQRSKIGLKLKEKVVRESVTSAGSLAKDFTRSTFQGETFSLAHLRGQVVLLDFWGSWCAPCRASMPHLIELHEKYKKDGFEIVGIAQERGKSLEESRVRWGKAINDLGIHWINVLNQENPGNMDIVKTYGVNSFPTKILLDREGKIILRQVASATDDLDIVLEQIFGY